MHTSYSSLNTFLTCPQKYKFQEIDRVKTTPSAEQVFGSLIHKTMKYIHTSSQQGLPSREEALDFFSRHWKEELFDQKDSANVFFKEGLAIINQYFKSVPEEEKKRSIVLERRFIVKVKEHTLGGAIDRVDRHSEKDEFEIIDYKTARKIPPQKEIDQDLQLSIYLRAFISEWPSLFEKVADTSKIKLTLYFLRHNLRLSTTRTPQDLKEIDEYILDVIGQVEKAKAENRFDPLLNPLCDWCQYQNICPLWKHKFKSKVKSLKSKEKEIKETAEKFILLKIKKQELEKEIMELGKMLSQYLEEEKLGQFFTEKGSVLRSLRKAYGYNAQEVAKALLEWKKDPFAIMKVDMFALKKFATGLNPEQKRILEKLKKLEKESYSLMVKK